MPAIFPMSSKGGGQAFGMPDVCLTPAPPGPPVPVPYPNTAMINQASKTSTKVKVCGKPACNLKTEVPRTSGDEAGLNKGVVSGMNMSKMTYKVGSDKVRIEGQKAVYLTSMTAHNGANANMPAGAQIAPSQSKVLVGIGGGGGGGGGGGDLPGVSEKEIELAASEGDSREARAARAKVVKAHLKKHGKEWDPKSKTYKPPNRKQIASQLKGHDLSKPVKVGPPPPCPSVQVQFQRPGGFQGSYYTNPGSNSSSVGISSYARAPNGQFVQKVVKQYNVNPKAPYLESTAARVRDTWSAKGMSIPTEGGAIQRVIGDRAMALAR